MVCFILCWQHMPSRQKKSCLLINPKNSVETILDPYYNIHHALASLFIHAVHTGERGGSWGMVMARTVRSQWSFRLSDWQTKAFLWWHVGAFTRYLWPAQYKPHRCPVNLSDFLFACAAFLLSYTHSHTRTPHTHAHTRTNIARLLSRMMVPSTPGGMADMGSWAMTRGRMHKYHVACLKLALVAFAY